MSTIPQSTVDYIRKNWYSKADEYQKALNKSLSIGNLDRAQYQAEILAVLLKGLNRKPLTKANRKIAERVHGLSLGWGSSD